MYTEKLVTSSTLDIVTKLVEVRKIVINRFINDVTIVYRVVDDVTAITYVTMATIKVFKVFSDGNIGMNVICRNSCDRDVSSWIHIWGLPVNS